MTRRALIAIGVLFVAEVIVGCGSAPAPGLTLPPKTLLPPLPTSPVTATPLPTIPAPLSTVNPATLTAWTFFDLHDSARSDLIVSDGQAYRLDPKWQIESIHYLYRREGRGDPPAYAAQHIVRRDKGFVKNADAIDVDKIQSLVGAVNDLYPSYSLTYAFGGTWDVELVGTDGQRVLLQSSDRSDPDLAPWNVVYNGRVYAQFNGRLVKPVIALFGPLHDPTSSGEPVARKQEEPLRFSLGADFQHRQPVDGLVSLSSSFEYAAEAGQIEGQISANDVLPVDPMTTTVSGLKKVELEVAGTTQACRISPAEQTHPWGTDLRFTCRVNTAKPGVAFRYPITIELSLDSGESIVSAGEIGGVWDTSAHEYVPVLPLHIATAAAMNSDVRDLLDDHVVFNLDYDAGISTTTPLSGVVMGEILLAGQTQMAGRIIPYTIATPFVIQDGRFTRWGLTRTALNQLLDGIGRSPLAARIIKSVPDTTLNMVYAGADAILPPKWLSSTSWNPDTGSYRAHRTACLGDDAINLPQPNQPLRGFNFNGGQGILYWPLEFLLINDEIVVYDLTLNDYYGDRHGVRKLLTPRQLDTGKALPFQEIILSSTIDDRSELILWASDEASPEAQTVYAKIVDSLPVPIGKEDGRGWRAEGLTFVVNPTGELEVVACQ